MRTASSDDGFVKGLSSMRQMTAIGGLFVLLLFGRSALAAPSPAERAMAEALFQRGLQSMEEGKHGEACSAFAGALELETGLGTLLRAADCYDHIGRTASAWALFRDAEALAQRLEDDLRQQIARERAEALEARLSMVKLTLPKAPSGQQITIAGVRIPEAMWNAPIPVDPGPQLFQVAAPGYRNWEQEVDILDGPQLQRLVIPELVKRPQNPSVHDSSRRPATASRVADQPQGGGGASPWGTVLVIGGGAGLVAAGYLGYRAYTANDDSLDFCRTEDAQSCQPHGVQLREDAQHYATGATLVSAGSAALLLTGLGIWLWRPNDSARSEHGVLLRGSSLTYSGAW